MQVSSTHQRCCMLSLKYIFFEKLSVNRWAISCMTEVTWGVQVITIHPRQKGLMGFKCEIDSYNTIGILVLNCCRQFKTWYVPSEFSDLTNSWCMNYWTVWSISILFCCPFDSVIFSLSPRMLGFSSSHETSTRSPLRPHFLHPLIRRWACKNIRPMHLI